MEFATDENNCDIARKINDLCYIRIHPDKSEDAYRCYNCDKIKLHKLNIVEYINNQKNKSILEHALEYDDNRPLFY